MLPFESTTTPSAALVPEVVFVDRMPLYDVGLTLGAFNDGTQFRPLKPGEHITL